MVEKTFYSVDIKCKNCKKMNWLNKVPGGVHVDEYLDDENIRCRVCNCLLFVPKPLKEIKKDPEELEDD